MRLQFNISIRATSIDLFFAHSYCVAMILKSELQLARAFGPAMTIAIAMILCACTAPRSIADDDGSGAPPALATSRAAKAGLTLVFTEKFNRPDGPDLGDGWTQAAHYGLVHEQILHHRLTFEIPSGKDIPWGSATLDLGNPSILGHGHGLRPGDYFEISLRRLSEEGGLGVELFDSDQLRVGSDLYHGASPLMAWNGVTWVPIAFDKHGAPLKFDWNARHTVGVRFDSADGRHANFSYYIDGRYAGSWAVNRPETVLAKIGVYAQSKTDNARFEFQDLKIYVNETSNR